MPSAASRCLSTTATISPIQPLQPDLHERAWASIPHPNLPLIATAHAKSVTVFSLSTLSCHSNLTGGHTRSVRSVAWKPGLPSHNLCLVSGSFDATAGLWRWEGDATAAASNGAAPDGNEVEITASGRKVRSQDGEESSRVDDRDWEFTLVLEGHDSEIKGCAFAPSGAYLATCSRDKSVWIWEDIGASETDDEWETIAVLNEHEGDVKAVAWCPDVPGRNSRRQYSSDVLASASYDNTVRIWREDGDGEWVCVAVLEGHQGTVWGVEWEPRPKDGRFPRLLSCSADGTVRLWTLEEEPDEDNDGFGTGSRSSLGGIPNTMRRSPREEWTCTAVLPTAHDRDVYSVSWSKDSGMVASTGRDGKVALYKEVDSPPPSLAVFEGQNDFQRSMVTPIPTAWELLTTMPNSHGPFEVNHITWCRRYDAGSEKRGDEEMLVTTGDDGIVRSWQVQVDDAPEAGGLEQHV
ncbi:WD repeat protein [Metarhizium album ARSEF 1941]|uniref:Probable cytosolic iron-sulfur protein assembly protein 1 n=1 Tax=Metarhizium album (strain ARSEF 1941) TaxID=1081103 RepID=A0A0B2WP60_METAS|nr:WD repeat protein [Metarhizium album ARSEF 1941]KHN97826.1 WD repeat protein [Metarhizium album ARSEF 1941]